MTVDPIIYQQEPIMTPRDRTIAHIALIAAKHQLRLCDIMGKSRGRKIVTARNEAIRYVWDKHHGPWSSVDIGRFFGKDHSTILFAVGRLKNRKPKLWVQKSEVIQSHPTSPVENQVAGENP